jgi:hypothetical protein
MRAVSFQELYMSAIQTDVQDTPAAATPATPATEAVEVQKSARELALEALESRHQQQMAESNGYALIEDTPPADPQPAPAAKPAATGDEQQLAAQLADAPADTPASAAPATVKIKIDGAESEVPLDEVVRQYQKNASADKRLAEATRLLREAQEAQAQRLLSEQQEAQLRAQQATTAPPNTAATDTPPPVDESGKEFLKALFEGDEENALTALQKVMGGRQQPAPAAAPTLDIDQIANAVTQQVQQKFAVESALAQNQRDYPELYADPDMEALALTKIHRLREQTGSDFFTALDTVSKDMANKFGWAASTAAGRPAEPAPTTSSARTAKLEQKRSIDNVASVNTKTTTTELQPENPSDVIAAMKAARAGG